MAPAKSAGEVIAKEDRLKALRASHAAIDQNFRVWRGDHPDAPADAVTQDAPLDQREKKALLATIGAMLEIATGKIRTRAEAKVIIETWRQHYNAVRPHMSLNYLTPHEFKSQHPSRVHNPAIVQQ